MRKIAYVALVIASVALVSCGETVSIGGSSAEQGITVSATGSADVVPDAVRVSLMVSVVAESNDGALSQASSVADEVRTTLQAAGIESADLTTQTLSVTPEYSYTEREGQQIIGYRASQVFDVIIRDANGAGAVLDAVVRAGGDAVSVMSTTPIVDEGANEGAAATQAARKDAVEQARIKAEEYATLLGVELGDVVYIRETSTPLSIGPVARADAAMESSVPQIDLGTQRVSVTVEIRWQID